MGFDTALADRITAVVLFSLGIAMLYGGYTMDRLEIRAIHPASIPGLLPMILGAVLALCAALLFLKASQAKRQTAQQTSEAALPAEPPAQSLQNLLITAGWSSFYALFLVGWLSFFAATAIYIAGFIMVFGSLREAAAPTERLKSGAFTIVFSLLASAAISTLFRDAFLVRLP
ncbi:hypothetical protein HBA54_27095 [Pelagibius litoralis]|uniref:DUF1468 domain-containing protein n=1 Tax=Pelagibius litoralis TaxID=374515 RepID=A0A967F318_9PROT|nr:tripartite tricarboxylate transporter TctB family protein [Pelagibius litoralis]NIA72264.1 hypothetical protein [Pelagibius litoralis]